jgi:hypothetical protein
MMRDVVTSSGSREGVQAYIASKAYAPSRLPLEVTNTHHTCNTLNSLCSSHHFKLYIHDNSIFINDH